MSIAITFEKIHKRKPTDADLQRIYGMANAVGANENDTFLSLIMALDFYHGLYSETPRQIKAACDQAAQQAATASGRRIEELTASAVASASASVQQAALAAARAASITTAFKWIAGGLIACALVFALVGNMLFKRGYEAGTAWGRAEQKNEDLHLEQRDSFFLSPEGIAAYKLFQNGDLNAIINCTRPGWYKKNGGCIPAASGEGQYGWKMP